MRALHVHRIAGIGGSERHLLTLLPALRALEIEPLFAGLDVPGAGADVFYAELDRAAIPYLRVRAARDLAPDVPFRLARAIRELDATLVHTHLVHADVYGALATLPRRVPLVSTKHNDDPFRTRAFRFVERGLVARARSVIAITETLRRFLVVRLGLPEEKIEVIRYGLDVLPRAWGHNPPLDLPEGSRMLLAIARLVEQKGLDTAIRALPAIHSAHPDVVLVIAGDGPERERLAALARELGVADAVRMPGRAGDVAEWLARAELLVHPARWEGFGLVLLEAMLAGVPAVASAVSAIPEVVAEGETGVLVPPDDPDALAQAIGALLTDTSLRSRLGTAARERARRVFSVERMARETAALYRRVLSPAASTTASAHDSTE